MTGLTRWQLRSTILLFALTLVACRAKESYPDLFAIYTATLDGKHVTRIVADATRQMTHARVSPDHKWIAFTRYNNKGLKGLAEEGAGNYAQTEIDIVNMDGGQMQVIVPPKRGVVASNPDWTADSRGLYYISTDNQKGIPQINRIDIHSREITRVPTPEDLPTTDPHHVGEQIVFPVKGKGIEPLYIMNLNGSGLRQLTAPSIPSGAEKGHNMFGDYDPKLSPDGRKVAFMRYFGGKSWHVFVVDVASGAERDLTPPGQTDGVPEWSSDGRLLAFWHLDLKNLRAMGIYTMRPDGSERRMVPLPRGYLLGHPSFFPGDGSSSDARIIYSAKKMPLLP